MLRVGTWDVFEKYVVWIDLSLALQYLNMITVRCACSSGDLTVDLISKLSYMYNTIEVYVHSMSASSPCYLGD